MMGQSYLESALLARMIQAGIPMPRREYCFDEARRSRFDFAWPEIKVAVEVEGGIYNRGRHVRGTGYEDDCEKYNRATLLGWRVFRFTPRMIRDNSALNLIKGVLEDSLR